jgi:hypothetical protein
MASDVTRWQRDLVVLGSGIHPLELFIVSLRAFKFLSADFYFCKNKILIAL